LLIKLIHVDVEQMTAKNGKTYEQAEVLYETDGKKQTKKLMSFSNPTVFKAIKDANRGSRFDIETVKDKNDYWQWVSFRAVDNDAVGELVAGKPTYESRSATTTPTNRSFETKEERDARQRLIVRQSSLSAAVSILSPGAKTALNPEDVKALASDLTDWVFEKVDLFDMPNDLLE
jgi:HJR/Mrr/RecB family endonuclease